MVLIVSSESQLNASDYDLTLQSCDNVIFRVHKNNLQMHSTGFAAPDYGTVSHPDEKVPLSETSSVLELLLQYLYPGPQPDLSTVVFTDLAGLAEAAQKYEVWSAMEVSKAHMRNAIPAHGFEVLVYAAKHDFKPLADEAAEYSVLAPMTEAVDRLNPTYLRAFARYIDQYRTTINTILATASSSHFHELSETITTCLFWSITFGVLQRRLRSFAGPLAKVLDIFIVTSDSVNPDGEDIRPCASCFEDMFQWRAFCQNKLGKIKNMSTFF